MKFSLQKITFFLSILFFQIQLSANDTLYTNWKFHNLDEINDNGLVIHGNPKIIPINNDSAFLFDGSADMVVIQDKPLIGLDEFTIEIIFRVDRGGVDEQKFFHLQASPDIRILFELEFPNDTMWYMENYIQTSGGDDGKLHLIDDNKLFPTNRWYHAAIVYKNSEFKQYINYKEISTGNLTWVAPVDGAVSIGARMNQVNHMKGAVREARFAKTALEHEDFLEYGNLLEQNQMFVLDNLDSIKGFEVETFGNPRVVETDIGMGIDFNGDQDGIYILTNPIGASGRFTIETIIKPNDVYPDNTEPRYLHIEDPSDGDRRITMELRLNNNNEWYFDGFIKSPVNNLTLIDETKVHAVDGWEHVAITYGDGIFKTYVNYTNELTGEVTYHPISPDGKMSVGMRMNKVHYFNGIIQRIRVTQNVLNTNEFMAIYPETSSTTENTLKVFPEKGERGIEFIVTPNPLSKVANMEIYSPKPEKVSVSIYNLAGTKISTIYNGYVHYGNTSILLDCEKIVAGVYLIHVKSSNNQFTRKIIVI